MDFFVCIKTLITKYCNPYFLLRARTSPFPWPLVPRDANKKTAPVQSRNSATPLNGYFAKIFLNSSFVERLMSRGGVNAEDFVKNTEKYGD